MYEQAQRKSLKPQLDARAKAVIPMTISMANQFCKTQNKIIDDQPFQNIVVVGRLIQHSCPGNRHIFTVNDDTGILKIQLITQIGKKPGYLQSLQTELNFNNPPNQYVKCVLTPKLTGASHDQLIYYCNRIENVTDFNAISAHITQVILRHLQRQQGFQT